MNYIKPKENESYKDYIDRILTNRDNVKDELNYQERHHIIPKCKGGDNSENNLIYLYPEEHYYAHKLLAYENSEDKQLILAWMCMSSLSSRNIQRNIVNAQEYALSKKLYSDTLKGVPRKPETIKKISEHHADVSGSNNPMFGKTHTDEVKQKLREANLGKVKPEEVKRKISTSLKGRQISEETRKLIGANHWDCKGGKHPQARKVECIETGEIFDCVKSAGIWAGYASSTSPGVQISKHINHPEKCSWAGRHPVTQEKLHWRYTE